MSDRDHGGALDAAMARWGGVRTDWLDLSTGINPVPYPLPDLPPHAWTALPDAAATARLDRAARSFWAVPEGAALIAAPGASALIARIPALAPPGRVAIPGPTYNEHQAAFRAAGWEIVHRVGSELVRESCAQDTAPDDTGREATSEDAARNVVPDGAPPGRTSAGSGRKGAPENCAWVVVHPNNPDGRFADPAALDRVPCRADPARPGFAAGSADPASRSGDPGLAGPAPRGSRSVTDPAAPDLRSGFTDPATLDAPLTVIDESFCDICPDRSLIARAARPGTLILKSFGKFWGLAGLRLGFAIGDPRLVVRLADMLGPWPVSGPALVIGASALEDRAWAAATRARLSDAADRLDRIATGAGATLVGGTPLFRLYEVDDAARWADTLARRRILVRTFPYAPGWVRIGLPPQGGFDRLQDALHDLAP